MTFVDRPAEKVHRWPRVLVGCALLTSILAATWSTLAYSPYLAFIWWAPVGIVALPLVTAVARTFVRLCLISAALLVLLAVVGLYFALFIHLPAAFILFAAAVSGLGRDGSYRVAVAIGLTLTLAATVGWVGGIYRRTLSPPDTLVVQTSTRFDVRRPPYDGIVDYDGTGIGFGAESVSYSPSDEGAGPVLYVDFRRGLSEHERDRLRPRLLELPEVTHVRLCSSHRQDC